MRIGEDRKAVVRARQEPGDAACGDAVTEADRQRAIGAGRLARRQVQDPLGGAYVRRARERQLALPDHAPRVADPARVHRPARASPGERRAGHDLRDWLYYARILARD